MKLSKAITAKVWNFLARKRNKETPFSYSADDLTKEIQEGIKSHIGGEIEDTKFAKKSVYEISYLDVSHNQFKIKSFDDLPIAIEWLRYINGTTYKNSWFKNISCNFQEEFDACNQVPF